MKDIIVRKQAFRKIPERHSKSELEQHRQCNPEKSGQQLAGKGPEVHPACRQQGECKNDQRAGKHAELPRRKVSDLRSNEALADEAMH